MKYNKPFLSYDQQADLLIARGLKGDRSTILGHLRAVNYYRLSGYWYPFRRTNPAHPPAKLDEFGHLATFYRGCEAGIQKSLAARYGVADVVCRSWLRTLNTVRNVCAHHARLWNRVLGVRPMIPNKDPLWNKPVTIPNDRVFGVLTICRHCLGIIAPGSDWTASLKGLLDDYPDIPRAGMGLIPDWNKHPLWSK